jgi:hypothetical protein
MMRFQLVDRTEGRECGFCARPAPATDGRLMQVSGDTRAAYFCQDCAIEFATCMGVALQHAYRIMEADESVVH